MVLLGREAQPLRQFENPYGGFPKTTDTLVLTTANQTLLGPVPSGHVYRVFSVLAYCFEFVPKTVEVQTVQDNGTGHVFDFNPMVIPLLAQQRLPMILVTAATSDWFEQYTIHMEDGDIMRMLMTTAPAFGAVRVRASYWDVLQ